MRSRKKKARLNRNVEQQVSVQNYQVKIDQRLPLPQPGQGLMMLVAAHARSRNLQTSALAITWRAEPGHQTESDFEVQR